jgi:hypothetical protein
VTRPAVTSISAVTVPLFDPLADPDDGPGDDELAEKALPRPPALPPVESAGWDGYGALLPEPLYCPACKCHQRVYLDVIHKLRWVICQRGHRLPGTAREIKGFSGAEAERLAQAVYRSSDGG